ncbi:uncharacterized protein LOC113670171 [Pocillopora damicornis]|nr:uncharacterized protein LOC113670171 [Pocillopora damicornis]
MEILLLLFTTLWLSPVFYCSREGAVDNVIIHEVDIKDLDLAGKGHSFEEPAKRLYPDHTRLCPAKQRYVNSKDAFKGRFSKHAFILPIAFEMISCEKSNETSQSPNGSRCLGIMDCQETKSSKYFIVRDLASRKNGGCMVQRIVKLNSVPVECSCYWPLLLGSSPRLFFNRRRT